MVLKDVWAAFVPVISPVPVLSNKLPAKTLTSSFTVPPITLVMAFGTTTGAGGAEVVGSTGITGSAMTAGAAGAGSTGAGVWGGVWAGIWAGVWAGVGAGTGAMTTIGFATAKGT